MDQRVMLYYRQYRLDRFVRGEQISQFRVRHFGKGEPICELAQPINNLCFLVEGRVKVYLPTEQGRQLLLCFYNPLQILGDLELFEDRPTSTTTVEAVMPSICLSLERNFVIDYLATDAGFLRQLCQSLGKKLRRVIENSTLNLLHPLENRVASYILATAIVSDDQQLIFSGNMTEIADMLGTSFRHLHRTLQELCEQEILVKERISYRIKQRSELERRAAGLYIIPDVIPETEETPSDALLSKKILQRPNSSG